MGAKEDFQKYKTPSGSVFHSHMQAMGNEFMLNSSGCTGVIHDPCLLSQQGMT